MTPSGTLPTTTLQKIDLWCGVPVCWLFTLGRKLVSASAPPAGAPTGKILFIKLAEQGSTVLAQSAIRRAVDMVGRKNVFFVVFAENRFILDLLDLIPRENVLTIDAGGLRALVESGWKVLGRIRRMGFEAAVDLEFFARFSAAFLFSDGRAAAGRLPHVFQRGAVPGDLMTHRLLYNPYLHTSQIFAEMVEALRADPAQLPTFGAPPPSADEAPTPFTPALGEVETVRGILSRESGGRCGGVPIILLNANASDLLPLRRWMPERYVELARRLLAELPDVWIVMTGAPSEGAAAERLVAAIGGDRCISLAGKTSLRQLLVLYTLADLLVTNDSGPAHFASLTPINVVTLFGPETPRLFAARTPRNVALWSGIACSPCVNAYNNRQSPCRNNVCMQLITVDQVFVAACEALRTRPAREAQQTDHAAVR